MSTEHKMEGKDYITTQMRLIEIGKIADSLDLDAFLKCISNAETVAPLVDPTLYRKAADNMNAIKQLAEAAKKLKHAYGVTYKAVMETMLRGDMYSGKLEAVTPEDPDEGA